MSRTLRSCLNRLDNSYTQISREIKNIQNILADVDTTINKIDTEELRGGIDSVIFISKLQEKRKIWEQETQNLYQSLQQKLNYLLDRDP